MQMIETRFAGAPGAVPTLPRGLPLGVYRAWGSRRKLRWTPLREKVLASLWSSERLLGAYDIAQALDGGSGGGARKNAVSIYRILAVLEQAALVIPVVVRKRFLLSPDPAEAHWNIVQCPDCTAYAAIPCPREGEALRQLAGRSGFTAGRASIECIARCAACWKQRLEAFDRHRPAPLAAGAAPDPQGLDTDDVLLPAAAP